MRGLGVAVLALALGMASIASAESLTLAERAAAIERVSQEPDGVRVVVGHLSRVLDLSIDVLRAQRSQTGLGWGELLVANLLARSAGLTVENVVAELRGDKTWEDIARDHNVELLRLAGRVQQSQDIVEQRAEDKPAHATGDRSTPSSRRSGAGMGRTRR